jgi:photosystem II stability/assembly factor-like uncharacterized protein
VTILIVTAVLFFDVKDLCAHSPHDAIDAMAISPDYVEDQTIFIILSDQLRKSTDGGSSWRQLVNGLDHKDILTAVEVSPGYSQDRTVFVSSKGHGIYRSEDEGHSWIQVNQGLGSMDIGRLSIARTCDSADPRTCHRIVLAAGMEGGLYRTENGGDHWTQVVGNEFKITALMFSPGTERDDLARTPAAFFGDAEGFLYHSADGGKTWQQTSQVSPGSALTSIAVSPSFFSDATLLVGTREEGIWKSSDGGFSFTKANTGLPFSFRDKHGTLRKSNDGPILRPSEQDVTSIAISPDYARDGIILASLWNQAAFRSDNGGKTWKRHKPGLTCDYQADSEAYKSPHFRALRISAAFGSDKTVFLGGFDGLFKSTDGGYHWREMETLPIRQMTGLALSTGHPSAAKEGIPFIALTTYGGGAYTSDDQGNTWTVQNGGLSATRLTDIVFLPDDGMDSTLFSASYGRMLKLVRGQGNWVEVTLSHRSWRTLASSLVKKVGVPGSLADIILTESERDKPYATTFAVSPNFESDGTLYFGTRRHGVFKSADGGQSASVTWDAKGTDGSSALISSLAISPDFAAGDAVGDGTLFAGVYGKGVYKTIDRGNTWQPVNNGLGFLETWQSSSDMHYNLERKHVWVTISPNYGADQTLFAASGDGLYKTTNGGSSWQELHSPAYGEDAYIAGMAISPDYETDQNLMISIKGRGLFKSENGGATFDQVGLEAINNNHQVYLIRFSPTYGTDNTIYAASLEELIRSADGGNTWQVIDRPVRYEDQREVIRFEGEWLTSKGDSFSALTITHSDVAGSKATLDFVGTGISWIGTESNDSGIARVYIDGAYVGDADQFGQAERSMTQSFSVPELVYGPHTITVEVSGTKNPKSTGYHIHIDAFDILGTSPTQR